MTKHTKTNASRKPVTSNPSSIRMLDTAALPQVAGGQLPTAIVVGVVC
jgi:hypothetical protein